MTGYSAIITIKTKSNDNPIVHNFYKTNWVSMREFVNRKIEEYSQSDAKAEVVEFVTADVYRGTDTNRKMVATKSWNRIGERGCYWKIVS